MKKCVSLFLVLCMMVLAVPALAETEPTTAPAGENAGGLGSLLSLFGKGGEGEGQGLGGLLALFGGNGGEGEGQGLGGLLALFGGKDGEGKGQGLGALWGMFTGKGKDDAATGDGQGLGALWGMFGGKDGEGFSFAEGVEFSMNSLLGELGITPAAADNHIAAKSADEFCGTWQLTKFSAGGYDLTLEVLKKLGVNLALTMTVKADSADLKVNDKEIQTIALTDVELVDGALKMKMQGEVVWMHLTDAGELCLEAAKGEEQALDLHFAAVK